MKYRPQILVKTEVLGKISRFPHKWGPVLEQHGFKDEVEPLGKEHQPYLEHLKKSPHRYSHDLYTMDETSPRPKAIEFFDEIHEANRHGQAGIKAHVTEHPGGGLIISYWKPKK